MATSVLIGVIGATSGAVAGSAAVLGRWDVCAAGVAVWSALVLATWVRWRLS